MPSDWTRSMYRVLAVVVLILATVARSDAQATGLRFASAAELQGVPLASTPYSGASLPPRVDLSADFPVPGQQGHQNSCVAWAVAYALKTYDLEVRTHAPLERPDGLPDLTRHFSPAFVYNQINHGHDGGSSYIDALRLLHDEGAAPWTDMPYSEADFLSQPSAAARAAAARFRIDFWRQVNVQDQVEVKAQLNAGFPVLIGAVVDAGLPNLGAPFVWDQHAGPPLGGHAMVVVGYDDGRNAFRVINSWGPAWGDHGYFWIDYQFFPQVVREGYVVSDAVPAPGPVTPAPTPAPQPPVASATFAITNVNHNLPSSFGPAMRFDGMLNVPPGSVGNVQVVIQVYLDAGNGTKGAPVGSLNPQFALPQGLVATGTPPIPLSPNGLQTPWFALLPYFALNVPRGGPYHPIQTNLVAEPVLYIDNFGVKSGGLIPFFVRL